MTASEICRQAGELHRVGRFDEAIARYQEAVAVDRRCHPAWYALGCALDAQGNHAAALACFQEAVVLTPAHGPSHHNLGNVHFALGMVDEALDDFRTAINLGAGFLPRTAIATIIPGCPGADNEAVLAARRNWAETHLPAPDGPSRSVAAPIGNRPLRVGYLSSFFAKANWMKPVWGLVNRHDRRRVKVHLFSDAPESQCLTGYRRQAGDRFFDISGLSNAAAAGAIKACNLDLLIDLNGYSRVDRLAVTALKPAPVLAGWFNYYATSGLASHDYLIGDEVVAPAGEESWYLEKIVRVPGSYLTFEVLHPAPDVTQPPGLATGNLTFGCLASSYKITDPVIEAWSQILRRAPGTRLYLKNAALRWPDNRQFLARRFARHDVDPDRITMEGPADHFDFLAAYRHVDVALDTFPYNGGTTTMEALWQGVPVIAFHGDRWAARQSASILGAAGLTRFVCRDAEEYVDCAVRLALAPDTLRVLAGLRCGMRDHLAGASICDTTTFARQMETLYAKMCAHLPHQSNS